MKNIDAILNSLKEDNNKSRDPSYFLIHQVRYRFILNKVQSIAKEKKLRILDVGCFPYHIGKALEELGHNVYGIASQHEPITNKNISIINIEKENFPYNNNFFDIVLFNEVIEHLPQSPIPSLREIYRVSKKGAFIMITTPNITRSINRIMMLFGKNVMYPISVFLEDNGKGGNRYHRHNREYILPELMSIITAESWQIYEANKTISYTPFREKLIPDSPLIHVGKIINYLLMIIFPSLRDTIFVIGKKN